MYTGNIYLGGL